MQKILLKIKCSKSSIKLMDFLLLYLYIDLLFVKLFVKCTVRAHIPLSESGNQRKLTRENFGCKISLKSQGKSKVYYYICQNLKKLSAIWEMQSITAIWMFHKVKRPHYPKKQLFKRKKLMGKYANLKKNLIIKYNKVRKYKLCFL